MTRDLRGPHRLAVSLLLAAAALVIPAPPGIAQDGRITLISKASFATVAEALEKAIADQNMGLVCHANAQRGAAARGVKLAGNQVFMVFRNDFAVRIISAAREAGFEAPMRIYLYENSDGTATLTYFKPSAVFRPYPQPEVAKVAAELDLIFQKIVAQALAVR
ncbi:MAG: DUF302 domain-containing protein [Candidatus Rokubacteria bacterium]|nr:DUF302 domain-containing protein [Candidatus Rokubacteria bacterium]